MHKKFDKIQHPFNVKILREIGIQGNFLNLRKSIYKKLQLTYLMVKVRMLFC